MNTTSTHTTESQTPAAWWQAFDESEATVVNQYVWGARPGHRDELILRDRVTTPVTSETSSEPPEPDERLWSLMDYYDPTSAVNTEGEVAERYRFSAFGLRSILAPDFSPRTVSHYDWDFASKGQFLDSDTGYYNYGYRYYSPELGRWLSRDPIGEEGGDNLYGMAINNPINALDFQGMLALPGAFAGCIGGCILGGIGGLIGGLFGSWTARGAFCGLLGGGLNGCCSGAVCVAFPFPAACIGGSCLCSFATSIVEQMCNGGFQINSCSGVTALLSGVTGCLGGAASLSSEAKMQIISFLVGIDIAVLSTLCLDDQ